MFLQAVIPFVLAAAAGGFGGPAQGQTSAAAVKSAGGSGKGMTLADSFLVSMGAMAPGPDQTKVAPFATPEAPRARSLGQLGLGSASMRGPAMAPAQQLVMNNPTLQSDIAELLSTSKNADILALNAKYRTPMPFRQAGTRQTLDLPTPKDIDVSNVGLG